MISKISDGDRSIIAFVHIEKAAGTTLIHLLRNNFLFSYCDVKTLSKESKRIFTASDLKKVLLINPMVRCIGGHSIKPFSDLRKTYKNIRYITLFRSPLSRYVSNYVYWRNRLRRTLSFQDFLNNERTHNFQTKKIAGECNLEKAKEILNTEFFLAGVLEEFDEFLILLKGKLAPFKFFIDYEKKNVANKKTPWHENFFREVEKYREQVLESNQIDSELYDYVRSVLLLNEKELYGPDFHEDVLKFKIAKAGKLRKNRVYIDYILRKIYYEKIFGFIRKRNGLPAKGYY